MTVSQNGYTANDRSLIASYTIPGTTGKIALRKGDVATVLLYVAARFNKEVERLEWPGVWGYAERNIIGSETVSNHASGTAEDLNAPQHPLATSPTANFSSAQIVAINRILNDCAGVVRWGGNYNGRKDGMHFEIVGSTQQVAILASRIKNAHPPAPAPGGNPRAKQVQQWQSILEFSGSGRDGKYGSHTDAVSRLMRYIAIRRFHATTTTGNMRLAQSIVDTTVDGIYGPHTDSKFDRWVKQAQSVLGVKVDGIWGPKTDKAFWDFRAATYMKY